MKTPAPITENTYPLTRWTAWPEEVDGYVNAFYEATGEIPNALVASTATLRRMDIAAARENVADDEQEAPAEGEYAALGGMLGPDYVLTFLVNEKVPERHVWLVFEDFVPDGGEPETDDAEDELRRAA